MRIGAYYSHLNGYEYLAYRKPGVLDEVRDVIASVDASACRTKVSEEKRMRGKLLHSPEAMNAAFAMLLNARGWRAMRRSYYCVSDEQLTRRVSALPPEQQKEAIEADGKTPIVSYTQTDFFKDRTAIEVQFGKYSFVAFDLFVKHMGFYVSGEIDVGIEILPMKSLQSEMSSGPSYYERELQHVIRQGRGNPPVPLVMFGVEP